MCFANFRYFSTEYLARYGSLTATYYPEYAASAHAAAGYIGNGYFEVASPRSLTTLPYDAASQFNRYFEADKVDCKYNPNSESPKTEFPQQQAAGQPTHPAGQPAGGQHTGKENNNVSLEVVKTEPSFGALGTSEDDVVVELQQFVNSATSTATTTTAPTQIILVCEISSFMLHVAYYYTLITYYKHFIQCISALYKILFILQ